MTRLIQASSMYLFALFLSTAAVAQTLSPGFNLGGVSDEQGLPIASAKVSYQRLVKFVGTTAMPILAPGETVAQGVLGTNLAGLFSMPSLPVGDYLLCATTSAGAYLDPCKWESAVKVSLGAATAVSPSIVMKKGVFLNVTISDPSGVIAKPANRALTAGNLVVGVKFGKGAFLGMETITLTATGRTYQMAVPAGVPLNLWLYARGFSITTSSGNSIPELGAMIPFQATAGQDVNLSFTAAKTQ